MFLRLIFITVIVVQGGFVDIFNATKITVKLPIYVNKVLFATNAQIEGVASKAPNIFYGWHQGGADNKTEIEFLTTFITRDTQQWIIIAYS
ncbi:hypothetical protein [Gallibacterium anatis]|uniref:hypothetical protein n=1 Tax=Gallibacterium anatis TaxID=750 RepID=UPI0005312B8C|nr:hypothetical protein [Gallibacterium anatis]KGQ44457.1 hypothetical protein JP29_08865 [Gallibacterium anatis]